MTTVSYPRTLTPVAALEVAALEWLEDRVRGEDAPREASPSLRSDAYDLPFHEVPSDAVRRVVVELTTPRPSERPSAESALTAFHRRPSAECA